VIGADWKNEARALIQQLDPHAVGPLYLLDAADVGANGDFFGCHSLLLDIQVRSRLKARGEWFGRGPVILIDVRRIRDHFRKIGATARDIRKKTLAVVLHEHIHSQVGRPPISEQETDASLARMPETAAYLRTAPIRVGLDDAAVAPWKDHCGLVFGRGAVHMAHRATQAGLRFTVGDLWASALIHDLGPHCEYVEALGDEPAQRIGDSLRQIINSPAPAYASFCRRDIQRSLARRATRARKH
jgi:hypothetical protein